MTGPTGSASLVDSVQAAVRGRLSNDSDVASLVHNALRHADPLLPATEVERLGGEVLGDLAGFGPMLRLLDDPQVTDILVNGPGEVWVERDGTMQRSGVAIGAEAIAGAIEHLLAVSGRRVDRSSPIVDARLADGSRLNVVLSPIAVDGPCVTIRRFADHRLGLADFADPATVELLVEVVAARRSVVVSGGTGAGKTSLLNALAAHIAPSERVVTIEDAAELRLPGDHVVRLETRPPTAEGSGRITVDDLVRNALRMRPDRLIVGECRGVEAFDMVQAMHTGHRGSLTTVHANDAGDALARLETMMATARPTLPLAVLRAQLASAIDLVVHVGRDSLGQRRITRVVEVGTVVDGYALPLHVLVDVAGVT